MREQAFGVRAHRHFKMTRCFKVPSSVKVAKPLNHPLLHRRVRSGHRHRETIGKRDHHRVAQCLHRGRDRRFHLRNGNAICSRFRTPSGRNRQNQGQPQTSVQHLASRWHIPPRLQAKWHWLRHANPPSLRPHAIRCRRMRSDGHGSGRGSNPHRCRPSCSSTRSRTR